MNATDTLPIPLLAREPLCDRYAVVCDDYHVKDPEGRGPQRHRTLKAAQRQLADAERLGVCPLDHRIVTCPAVGTYYKEVDA